MTLQGFEYYFELLNMPRMTETQIANHSMFNVQLRIHFFARVLDHIELIEVAVRKQI